MRRFLCGVLLLCLLGSLCACAGDTPEQDSTGQAALSGITDSVDADSEPEPSEEPEEPPAEEPAEEAPVEEPPAEDVAEAVPVEPSPESEEPASFVVEPAPEFGPPEIYDLDDLLAETPPPEAPPSDITPSMGDTLVPVTKERSDWLKYKYKVWFNETWAPRHAEDADVYWKYYYGTYGGHEVLYLMPNTSIDNFVAFMVREEIIAGYGFIFPTPYHLWLFDGDGFITISDAYDKGLLTKADIETISWVKRTHRYLEGADCVQS